LVPAAASNEGKEVRSMTLRLHALLVGLAAVAAAALNAGYPWD
jgi:hypothetical protein